MGAPVSCWSQREVNMEREAWTTPHLVALDSGLEEKHKTWQETRTVFSDPPTDQPDGES